MLRMLRKCTKIVHTVSITFLHVCVADADLPVVPKLKDQFTIIEEAHYGKGPLTKATDQEAVANI